MNTYLSSVIRPRHGVILLRYANDNNKTPPPMCYSDNDNEPANQHGV